MGNRVRVLVAGGGWAGCAAALAAARAGVQAVMCERTDMLLGTGLAGGIMRNNGRWTAAEEIIALGGGELFLCCDENALHRNLDFPGHRHASLYNVISLEPAVRRLLARAGVEVRLETRIVGVISDGRHLEAVRTHEGEELEAAAFVDATGTAGPMGNCHRYGNGCVMCMLRCPAFGPRVSVSALAGVGELAAVKRAGHLGAMSGSCKLPKASLAPELAQRLSREGVVRLPLPEPLAARSKLGLKACQQYALPEYAESVILLDTGDVKLMSPYLALDDLRRIPGLENAVYTDPKAGGRGNSVRFTALTPHGPELRVEGRENLFCAGEKCGVLVGHTEAIVTGTLAGHNAARVAQARAPVTLPPQLAVGDFVAYTTRVFGTPTGQSQSFTFAGSTYFERMQANGLYLTDPEDIAGRIRAARAHGLFT
ncbi:MAG: FAD-dependent oxidoreductase [Bacillota bacterium]